MQVISSEKLPIKMWLNEIEDGALKQAKNLANLPFAFHHVAIMPDSHQGYGMPIGGVLATRNVVVPNAVGVDIGCGMCAVKTNINEINEDGLKLIMGKIREEIPVGFEHHKTQMPLALMPKADLSILPIIREEFEDARTQLGTLGGGNHFIEIQKDQDGNIWIMLHSGSRNLGFKVAHHYNLKAQELNTKWYSNVPPFKGEDGLAFLPLNSIEGFFYMNEMKYCIDFALANRKLMMDRIMAIFNNVLGGMVEFEPMINIAHNYASLENHFGENVVVHRKGATLARKGKVGIIPGSMGTSSYIVKGLGNPDSFESCSHGAGRKMSRSEAIKTLSLEEEQKKMEGILGKPRTVEELDESAGAYKQIDEVMSNQSDLVEIITKLKPIANIKG